MRVNFAVGSYLTPIDAELARSVLAAEGIDARIEGDLLAGTTEWAQGTPNIRLLVADQDAEEARQLLERHERELAEARRAPETLDARVARAYRLSFVGLFVLPVFTQALSMWQLLQLDRTNLSERSQRRFRWAMNFNILILSAVAYWLGTLMIR